jgi:hypothetical protein
MNILITQKTRTEDSSATYQRTRLYVSEDHILIPIAVINKKLQKDSRAAAKHNVHTAVRHIVEMQYVIKSVSLRGLCGSYQRQENPRAKFQSPYVISI